MSNLSRFNAIASAYHAALAAGTIGASGEESWKLWDDYRNVTLILWLQDEEKYGAILAPMSEAAQLEFIGENCDDDVSRRIARRFDFEATGECSVCGGSKADHADEAQEFSCSAVAYAVEE
jgi:hypothetical protein